MPQLDWYIRSSLKPRHLHLLVALDDFRNIGRVAASVNITQPAVSKSLAELEKGLGIKLFERNAHGVNPTAYGECLIRHARSMLADLAKARDELNALMYGTSGRICIGALSTAVHALVPQSLALLKQRSPNTTVIMREGSMETLLPDLWSGKLDLIVGRLPNDRSAPGLQEKILSEEAVTLVAGSHNPLSRRKKVRWADLKGVPWVLPPVGTFLRDPVERAFAHHGVPMPTNRVETLSVHLLCSYLQLTDAVAFLGNDVSRHYQRLGLITILPLQLAQMLRPLGMAWSQQREPSPNTKLMMSCLEEVARSGNVAKTASSAAAKN